MKRSFYLLTLVALFALNGLNAAEINVASGGDIQTAIDNAVSGDVIVLEDGGVYDANVTLIMDGDKALTFAAEAGATVKPEVVIDGFRFGETSGSGITTRGLRFNGSFSGDYFIKADQAGDGAKHIKLYDTEVHSYTNGLLGAWGEPLCYIDTVLFSGCYFYELNSEGGWMCQFLSYGSRACIKHYRMENSTIDGYNELFMNYDNAEYVIKVELDHCTFHRKVDGHSDARNNFAINAADGSSFTMTNSIISGIDGNDTESLLFSLGDNIADTLKNCIYYNIDESYDINNQWSLMENFTEMDPEYADPSGFDLTLSATSGALTYGTDGGPIGDPRWAGVNTAVKNVVESPVEITNTQNTVYLSEEVQSIYVFSLTGALVKSTANVNQMSVQELNSGIYMLTIMDKNGAQKALKIIR